ncbi:ATP-binding protein [Crocosphaera chwakensis]|uniref:histidine kinase n=1 Tax=Crocosphaera chwakensis CCY0110 TaxID=391612 RepID=A3ILD9_9CHRO|nr:ATP-binding protein [Crocosphaera chwakensis]EAZ92590.1 multi-sensor signal transduction histidine kinase [Crocosphaera chwakensis CCY0110]
MSIQLDDILMTEELSLRSPRQPNLQAENEALRSLARQLVHKPEKMLQSLVEMSVELCDAGTAGVSLLGTQPDNQENFCWVAIAGTLASQRGGCTLRNNSPCGICLEQGSPMLFSHPERYFTYFQAANIPFVEALVLPLICEKQALGTIWIITHDEGKQFDGEDVRLMSGLADFTAAALLRNQQYTQQLLASNTRLVAEESDRKQAEARAEALIANLPGGAAFVVDQELRYLLAAGEALAIANFKPEDFIGHTIFEVLPPQLAASYEPMYRQALAGEPFEHEHQAHDRWYISRGTPLYDSKAEVYTVLVISYDITDRKQAEVALRESEEKYRSLFNSMDEGYFLVDVIFDENDQPIDLFYIDENPAAIRMTGQSFRGRRLRKISPNYEEYWYEIFGRVAQMGQSKRLERYAEPDKIWYDFYVFKVGGDDTQRVAVVFNDITDRKRAEATLEANAKRQEFLLELSDTLRPLVDAEAISYQAACILGQHLKANRVGYAEADDNDETIVVTHNYTDGVLGIEGRYHYDDYGSELLREFKAGRTVVRGDIANDPSLTDKEKAAHAVLQLGATVNVPLVKAGRLVAVLFVHFQSAHEWLDSELVLITEVAERIWDAVKRARAEAALRESELQRVREQSAREQEQQRAESLAEVNHAKTQFFSNVSHEFRTPLTLLLSPLEDAIAQLGKNKGKQDNVKKQLQLAYRNALRLLKLVNTLLDFSRIEAERIEENYQPTDLAAYTTDLASLFRSTIENAGLQFMVNCQPLSKLIWVDREMWEKIVLNLLSNAFKFTFEGEIRVSLREEEDNSKTNNKFAVLEVQDTGIGISSEELPHIFERFYQSKSHQGRSYEGSGIGLSLVAELVKLHGGTVEVSSQVGKGTTFTITLPTGTEHLPINEQAHLVDQSQDKSFVDTGEANAFVKEAQSWLPEINLTLEETEPVQVLSESEAKAKILLVEDNADMRNYLKRLLDPYYEVETANDGLEALTLIRNVSDHNNHGAMYDLILTDIMMPRLDGFELLQSLRDNSEMQKIPIIMLSARAGEEFQIEGLEAGADDYLWKPFSARQLLARVKTHLKLTQMRQVQALNETLEAQVKIRTAQLEAINEELEAFSYSVSHDLQTPLRYISSFVERLQGKLDAHADASSLRYLSIINEATSQAHRMIEDLLEFSRGSNTQLRLTQVSMEQLVQEVRSQLKPEISDRLIEWHIEPLPEVQGDPQMLRLVWQNLMSNAVKYTCNCSTAIITISSRIDDNEIVFFVEDNGAGFDMKYQNRLFSLFQRLHSQEQFAGTGVGLANVRRIIHRHGGRVWAESTVNQGARFYFSLPKQEKQK